LEQNGVEVGVWLSRLGLERYQRAFLENDVDAEVLPSLTADDLIGIGVTSIGHRRKLLAAITALREGGIGAVDQTDSDGAPPGRECAVDTALRGAERRQLTVMFCDLVGSTALSTQLDPEDMRDVITAYHRAVTDIVVNAGGFVSRYLGDGVLIYFGYPEAHEDDAERAVRAGLNVIDAVRQIYIHSIKLQTRAGIATGLVVVGDGDKAGLAQEKTVIGETPNIAARLQVLADPDTVVIGASTRGLVGALFEYHDLGLVEVKGITSPISAWQVLRPNVVTSRFEALHGSTLTRLVGRDEEIDLLLRRWALARGGNGQVVLVSGEPGIGKSRIVAELQERLRNEPHFHLQYFCSPYHQDSALFPFVDQLGRAGGFARDDSPDVKFDKLKALLTLATPDGEDVALFAELLSLPSKLDVPPKLSPQQKKERMLGAFIRQLQGLARKQPTLVIFEDAHWIDPTSRELLDLAVEQIQDLRALLVLTFRSEFQPPWAGLPRVSLIALNRLDRDDRTALVIQICGRKLSRELVSQIADRSDGVPLFVEELTKSVLEGGRLQDEPDRYLVDRPLPRFAIPTSLHDLLTARLDRLTSVRHVAQIGAAIGREFSYTLLQTVSQIPEEELQQALARLVASELVFQRGTLPNAVYSFKHTLVQDAAYGSLLRDARRKLHAQIAEAFETQYSELMDTEPSLVALHYAEAGLAEKSAQYWGQAGRKSAANSAMAEAVAQFQKGLAQLALLPDSRQRREQELDYWSALGAALRYVKGQAAPEMGHAFARARELWEQLGSPAGFLHIPYGQSNYHIYRGEFELAQRLDEDLLRLSSQRNDSAGLVLGHRSSGRGLLLVGKFGSARYHLEKVLALYDPNSHHPLLNQTGSHPRVGSQGHLGITLFCLGFPDQALKQSNAAVAEAVTLAHPPSLAASLAMSARLLSLARDPTALVERADQLIALATEHDFPMYRALGMIYRGYGKTRAGDVLEGLSLLRSGSNAYIATGAEYTMPYYIALLAGACELAGRIEESSSLLDEAAQVTERIGELWYGAELYRHRGRLLRLQGNLGAAEEFYCKSLTLAEEQEAKLWELRALASLVELGRGSDRHFEYCDRLARNYGWFTEGFNTQDLKDARAALNEPG
jgi:class 3 adenylate cyclase/predicted ATPase